LPFRDSKFSRGNITIGGTIEEAHMFTSIEHATWRSGLLGTAVAAASPILPAGSGGQVEFEFPDHGVYPYRDGAHPERIGVVWSTYY
jgi:hypothetical protein